MVASFIATPRAPLAADNLAGPSKGRLRRLSFRRDFLHNAFRQYRKGPREERSDPHLSNIVILHRKVAKRMNIFLSAERAERKNSRLKAHVY